MPERTKRPSTAQSVGSTVTLALAAALIALRLTGVVTWSWWWVLSPLWGGLALNLIGIALQVALAIAVARAGAERALHPAPSEPPVSPAP